MSARLAPSISRDTEFFWAGLKEHKLLIQRCTDCQTLRVPPRPMCAECQSLNWEAIESTGRGTVYSYVMPKYPPLPFFEYPYVVALVELDEGVRIICTLLGVDDEAALTADTRVTVGLGPAAGGAQLPVARPTRAGPADAAGPDRPA
jgi:uncharacterized OB-fold protein